MAGLSQGSEAAVAASPKPAVAASPEDLASLRVSQPLKLSNVPLKWIRDSCEDPRGTPTTDCVVLSQGSEPAVAASQKVKAKRAKYIKQCMKQYNVMHQAVAGERSMGFKTDAKTATRGGGGSKTATHP